MMMKKEMVTRMVFEGHGDDYDRSWMIKKDNDGEHGGDEDGVNMMVM